MTDKREVELPAISLDPDDFDHGIDRSLARERQWRLGRERQLLAALQQLHVVLEREAATTARYDAKISQLEQYNEAITGEKFSDRNHAALRRMLRRR